MKKVYKERVKKLIEDYNTDCDGLMVANIRGLMTHRDTIREGIERYLDYGECAMYLEDIEHDLKTIYGDDYDMTRYYNKDGNYKIRNNEYYIKTIYKSVMGQMIWEMFGDELKKEL